MLQLFTWSIISGNRYPIFRIMLYGRNGKASSIANSGYIERVCRFGNRAPLAAARQVNDPSVRFPAGSVAFDYLPGSLVVAAGP